MRYYQYDANGNLVGTDDTEAPAPSPGGGGSGTVGSDGKDGSIIYPVDFEPVTGQSYTGYNPQDFLLGPSSTLYPLKSA